MTAPEWFSYYLAEPAAFFAALLFIVAYTFLAPWWRNPIGITMVALDGVIAGVILPHMLRLLFGVDEDSTFFIWFVIVVFTCSVPVILWRTGILVQAHRGRFRLPWMHNGTTGHPDGDREPEPVGGE